MRQIPWRCSEAVHPCADRAPAHNQSDTVSAMGIVRTVEWRMAVSADEAWRRAFSAMTALELAPQSDGRGELRGAGRRSLSKNRWASEVVLTVVPVGDTAHVTCRVDMVGSKHFAMIEEISQRIGDDAFDDAHIADAVKRLGAAGRVFGRKEVAHLRHLVGASETVLAIGQGSYGSKLGIVVLTDQRLFFFEKSLGSESIEEFGLSSISSITVDKKLTGETMRIHASGNTAEIRRMSHGHADALVRAFRTHKHAPPASSARVTPAASQPPDTLERLRKLGELRDAGVLTAEEFEAKKAILLDRI